MCRILYLSSSHPTLEVDDLKLMDSTGAEIFSTGIYLDPSNPVKIPHLLLREGALAIKHNPELRNEFLALNPGYALGYSGLNIPRPKLSKNFVDKFDIVVVVYIQAMIDHWDILKDKPIIIKTCGNTYKTEKQLKKYADCGVIFVRGSKNEFKIPYNNGGRVIRVTIDPDYYKGWLGKEQTLLTFHSHFKERRNFPPVQKFLQLYKAFNTRIYGAYAKGYKDPLVLGTLNYKQQLEEYQKCAVYFNISSGRAPITYNFIEAMCVGIPVVTFGVEVSSSISIMLGYPPLCEIPELIINGKNGFYSNEVHELKDYITTLMNDRVLANNISKEARKTVTKIFSVKKSRSQWKNLFNELGASLS